MVVVSREIGFVRWHRNSALAGRGELNYFLFFLLEKTSYSNFKCFGPKTGGCAAVKRFFKIVLSQVIKKSLGALWSMWEGWGRSQKTATFLEGMSLRVFRGF